MSIVGKERVIELRDVAVAIAKRRGIPHNGWFTWADNLTGSSFLPKDKGLLIQHWTPSVPGVSARPLPHGITVSIRDGVSVKILLDVEWAEDGSVNVISYEPGEWEHTLEELGGQTG
jgi:hypothetical protein